MYLSFFILTLNLVLLDISYLKGQYKKSFKTFSKSIFGNSSLVLNTLEDSTTGILLKLYGSITSVFKSGLRFRTCKKSG